MILYIFNLEEFLRCCVQDGMLTRSSVLIPSKTFEKCRRREMKGKYATDKISPAPKADHTTDVGTTAVTGAAAIPGLCVARRTLR